jgi:hypothetical protein
MDRSRRTDKLASAALRSEPYRFHFVGAFDGKCLLGSSIVPEDTTARLHAAVGTVNDGLLQNVRKSIV